MADLSFLNMGTVEQEADNFYSSEELLAPGWYKVRIIKEEIKDTESGGKMLVFSYQLDSGSTISDNFNLINKNEQAVNIAKSSLAKIAQSVGLTGGFPKSTDIMFGRPFEIFVVRGEYTSKKTGEKKPKNEIKLYRACQEVPKLQSNSASGW